MKLLIIMFSLLAPLALVVAQQNDETKCCCTTYDTSVCLSNVHERVDRELNENYKRAVEAAAKFTNQDLENLKDAERKWIEYRDATCKAEYGLWGGGSGGPNAEAMCLIRLTKQRTIDIRNTYLDRP
jgi:uncharacterized protein YecT (DUF1311 family)